MDMLGTPKKAATGDGELRLIPLVEKSTQTISDPEADDCCSQHAIPTAPANRKQLRQTQVR